MSKKPAAALSASLVAVKGAAVPAPAMPGRGAATTPIPPPIPTEERAASQSPVERGGIGTLAPLNFRVSATFRREFKTYAVAHDLKLNELLRRGFEAYRQAQGD